MPSGPLASVKCKLISINQLLTGFLAHNPIDRCWRRDGKWHEEDSLLILVISSHLSNSHSYSYVNIFNSLYAPQTARNCFITRCTCTSAALLMKAHRGAFTLIMSIFPRAIASFAFDSLQVHSWSMVWLVGQLYWMVIE